MKNSWIKITLLVIVLLVIAGAAGGWYYSLTRFAQGYCAVFLTNNQVYFGKVAINGWRDVKITDVFYLQVNKQADVAGSDSLTTTADITATGVSLNKLGNELHGPKDEMIINREHILFIERLKSDSKVVKAIESYQK
jgi:hypothetical protein